MTSTTATRRDAVKAVGRFVGTSRGREILKHNHYVNETRILAVPETEPLDVVAEEHIEHGGRTLVAIYFPDRCEDGQFEFIQWEAVSRDEPDGWNESESVQLGRGPNGHTSSIGMVADMMSGRIRRLEAGVSQTNQHRMLDSFGTQLFAHS